MASIAPFDQLDGLAVTIYLAPVGEAVPAVNAAPAGNWIEFGETDGEQSLQHKGALTYFRTNKYQGPRKAVRPVEDVVFTATIVSLTLENYARILDRVADVVAAGGPPAIKTMPLERGRFPNQYAMLIKGEIMSPYGAFPAMYVVPIVVLDGEPTATIARDGRVGLEIQATAIVDTTQTAGKQLGWMVAQTA